MKELEACHTTCIRFSDKIFQIGKLDILTGEQSMRKEEQRYRKRLKHFYN